MPPGWNSCQSFALEGPLGQHYQTRKDGPSVLVACLTGIFVHFFIILTIHCLPPAPCALGWEQGQRDHCSRQCSRCINNAFAPLHNIPASVSDLPRFELASFLIQVQSSRPSQKESFTTTLHLSRSLQFLLDKMSPIQFSTNNAEGFFSDTVLHNDTPMDELLAQWTHENDLETFDHQAQGWDSANSSYSGNHSTVAPNFGASEDLLTRDSTSESLFLTPVNSPGGSTESGQSTSWQANQSLYPEAPSLTAGTWVPTGYTWQPSHHDFPPTSCGDFIGPIDPALMALDTLRLPTPNPSNLPLFPPIQPWPAVNTHQSPYSAPSTHAPPDYSPINLKIHSIVGPSRISKPRSSSPNPKRNKSPSKQKRRASPQPSNLVAPLSLLSGPYGIPPRNVLTHIQRPTKDRLTEALYCRGRRQQEVPRPMNSFILYRWAYSDLVGAVAKAGGNQMAVSTVAGESWRMESEEVREEFARLAEIEAREHERAWPDYRFRPCKKE